MHLKQTTGSRAQVMHGTAKKTTGGLTKSQLKYNNQGKIVSKKASALAKKNNRLVKAGYVTRKCEFGVSMKGGGYKTINRVVKYRILAPYNQEFTGPDKKEIYLSYSEIVKIFKEIQKNKEWDDIHHKYRVEINKFIKLNSISYWGSKQKEEKEIADRDKTLCNILKGSDTERIQQTMGFGQSDVVDFIWKNVPHVKYSDVYTQKQKNQIEETRANERKARENQIAERIAERKAHENQIAAHAKTTRNTEKTLRATRPSASSSSNTISTRDARFLQQQH